MFSGKGEGGIQFFWGDATVTANFQKKSMDPKFGINFVVFWWGEISGYHVEEASPPLKLRADA